MANRTDDETSLLLELMLQADVLCNQAEALGKKKLPLAEMHALSLKISQCRGVLGELQNKYEKDALAIRDPAVRADFRNLVISLSWVVFIVRQLIDARFFRKFVQIESGFTYLLITGRTRGGTP